MTTAWHRIPVLVQAPDPLTRVGLSAGLAARPELLLIEEEAADAQTVVIIVIDRFDDTVQRDLRAAGARGLSRFVLVASELADRDLLVAVELGVRSVALRSEATPETLVRLARTAASGAAALPTDLLGRLLTQVHRTQRHLLAPRGLSMAGLSNREAEVLRLVAQGWSTSEVATHLSYSQRTIKTILHDVINRFELRNRTHAVAYALSRGML